MDVKEQGNDVEEIMCEMMDVLENMQQEIRINMEKLKDEMSYKEKDWTEERNRLKERIEELEVRCEEYNEIKNNEMSQLEGREEMDTEREDVECTWNRKLEIMKELTETFKKNVDVIQEERKKNNTRVLIFTTTPSTSQLRSTQLASISTESVRNNNDIDLIETPSTSGRFAQNQKSIMGPTLDVWKHFKTIKSEDEKKIRSVVCNYCSTINTFPNATYLRNHLLSRCQKCPQDLKQEFQEKNKEEDDVVITSNVKSAVASSSSSQSEEEPTDVQRQRLKVGKITTVLDSMSQQENKKIDSALIRAICTTGLPLSVPIIIGIAFLICMYFY